MTFSQKIDRVIELAELAKVARLARDKRDTVTDEVIAEPFGPEWDAPLLPELDTLGKYVASLPDEERYLLQTVMQLGREQIYDDRLPGQEFLRWMYGDMKSRLGDVEGTVHKFCCLVNELPVYLRSGIRRITDGGQEIDSLLDGVLVPAG